MTERQEGESKADAAVLQAAEQAQDAAARRERKKAPPAATDAQEQAFPRTETQATEAARKAAERSAAQQRRLEEQVERVRAASREGTDKATVGLATRAAQLEEEARAFQQQEDAKAQARLDAEGAARQAFLKATRVAGAGAAAALGRDGVAFSIYAAWCLAERTPAPTDDPLAYAPQMQSALLSAGEWRASYPTASADLDAWRLQTEGRAAALALLRDVVPGLRADARARAFTESAGRLLGDPQNPQCVKAVQALLQEHGASEIALQVRRQTAHLEATIRQLKLELARAQVGAQMAELVSQLHAQGRGEAA